MMARVVPRRRQGMQIYTVSCSKGAEMNLLRDSKLGNVLQLLNHNCLGFFLFLFFFTFLLESNCFTILCQFLLYNKVNQLYVYIYPHISSLLRLTPTLPIPPLQVVTKHRADLPVLCGCFPVAIHFTFGSVYMSMPLSHFVPAYPSPTTRPSPPCVLKFRRFQVCPWEDLQKTEYHKSLSST